MAGSNVLREFGRVLQVPILAANESNCAAISEMTWGAVIGEPSFVLFKIDLGVGGAIVQDGKIMQGIAGGGGDDTLIADAGVDTPTDVIGICIDGFGRAGAKWSIHTICACATSIGTGSLRESHE